ncbi:hypothetical protein CPB86DRAFT_354904 [Serendipita vermifera]|nr:hypothetical protein CPB86DRAFT_354904 [Serendipita vermifera]
MISQEFTGTLFNSIAFSHEPFFDRVPAEDFQTSATTPNTTASVKDMYSQPQDSFPDTFPPTYAPFRRMSADTQTSSAESATYPSPDHKPNDKMNSLVLPPIHDLPRPLSPGNSDGSSTRSPQWPQPPHQQPSLHHHHPHHQQHHQHHQAPPQHHHNPYHHQQAPASSHLQQFQFPPIDHHNARRPQLHISPPADHRTLQTASYPTPTSTSTTASAYPSSAPAATNAAPAPGYGSYPLRRPEDQQPQQTPAGHYRGVAPPPPVVTPATLAAAVGTQTRRRGKLPKPVTEFLKKWLLAHTDHPYPTEDEKKWLCSETGLSMSQVSNWMINARRRILAPAAKANAAAAAAAAAANANAAAITSSATAAAATPYYSRSPPIRTVSGSSADSPYGNGSHYSAPRRESYAPYPMPASRSTNTHQPSYSSPATTYPSSAPPYSAAYHFQSGSASSTTGPATTSTTNPPPALSAYASATTLAPFGDSHEPVDRTKSPAGDFAYAPQ